MQLPWNFKGESPVGGSERKAPDEVFQRNVFKDNVGKEKTVKLTAHLPKPGLKTGL